MKTRTIIHFAIHAGQTFRTGRVGLDKGSFGRLTLDINLSVLAFRKKKKWLEGTNKVTGTGVMTKMF